MSISDSLFHSVFSPSLPSNTNFQIWVEQMLKMNLTTQKTYKSIFVLHFTWFLSCLPVPKFSAKGKTDVKKKMNSETVQTYSSIRIQHVFCHSILSPLVVKRILKINSATSKIQYSISILHVSLFCPPPLRVSQYWSKGWTDTIELECLKYPTFDTLMSFLYSPSLVKIHRNSSFQISETP